VRRRIHEKKIVTVQENGRARVTRKDKLWGSAEGLGNSVKKGVARLEIDGQSTTKGRKSRALTKHRSGTNWRYGKKRAVSGSSKVLRGEKGTTQPETPGAKKKK